MSFNEILSKIPVGSITKGGQVISPSFTKAVKANSELIPAGTVDVCQRETNHTSDADPRDHYTGVCFDEQGGGESIHFPTKR